MPAQQRLVTEHLERISWNVLEAYPEVVRSMIRRRAGVYALYRKDKLYYVGLATNLMSRLNTHLRDRHRGVWDRFSVYLTVRDEHIKELESLVLRIASPGGNVQSGKFKRSENLYNHLNEQMKNDDADRRALVLGGGVAKRRRKAKVSRASRELPLEGMVDRVIRLRGSRGKWEYSASLRRDGTIRYGSCTFDTPSLAARTAVGRACNGWSFWKYRDKDGAWVPLRNLKS